MFTHELYTHKMYMGVQTFKWVALTWQNHYNDVIMSKIASQITSLANVYSAVFFRCRSKKTPKLRITGLCAGNSPVTGEFPAQMISNAENISICWRHHDDGVSALAETRPVFGTPWHVSEVRRGTINLLGWFEQVVKYKWFYNKTFIWSYFLYWSILYIQFTSLYMWFRYEMLKMK